jgi:hypothetical protein
MLRRLIARLIGWRVVYLVDHDGEVTQRFAQPNGIGGWYAWRMSRTFNLRRVSLLPGGEIKPSCYVQRWVPCGRDPYAEEMGGNDEPR